MNVREKLVELVDDYTDHLSVQDIHKADFAEKFTDHLIAHSVTVQEWISVKDRLPDLELVEAKANDFDLYACLCAKVITGRKNPVVVKAWYDGTHFMDSDCIYITKSITHWMPLPQPPKGE